MGTQNGYLRLIDLYPGPCSNHLRRAVVVSDSHNRVAPKYWREGVRMCDWQASVNQKNEAQCVWGGTRLVRLGSRSRRISRREVTISRLIFAIAETSPVRAQS